MGNYQEMLVTFIFILLSFSIPCLSLLNCNVPKANITNTSTFGKLILSHVVLSPGRSNIERTFPNDIHGSRCNWMEGYGQLTQVGKRDQYQLGEWLRERYGSMADKMFVYSVDSDKPLSSVQATLAALFAPAKENSTDRLNWQPIPIHTVQKDQDQILEAKPCPKYEAALKQYLNSPPVVDINNENKELYRTLTNVTGMQIANILDVAELYETLEIENSRNMSLPDWAAHLFPGELSKFSVYSSLIATSTEKLQRLRVGPLFGEIARHLKAKMNKTANVNPSLFLYSGEKDTLAAVLNSLGVFNCRPLPSSAIVLIELWASQEELSITVSYKNESTREPYVLILPGYKTLCPLNEFLLLLENAIPHNWAEECSVPRSRVNMETIVLRVLCAVLAIVMIAMIVVVILCFRRRFAV